MQTGFGGKVVLVQIIFLALKITKQIDWSWWWVFSPVLLMLGLAILFWAMIMSYLYIRREDLNRKQP